MKKILLLLLFTVASYGQAVFDEGIQITGNANSATATKVNVQEANGAVNTQTIKTGFNKNIGLGGSDVVGANTLLNQYSTTPVDWTATTFNSGQVVFYAGKQWIAKIATVAGDVPSVSSKWEEITFEALANKTVIVDAIPTDGSNNAVSSNGVFDALATKAPISSVHNPVTLGTANGLSLSTQQLSLGLASSGVTGALSGTDWNTFNNKQPAISGLTANYLPKWNGSGFGNSIVRELPKSIGIGTVPFTWGGNSNSLRIGTFSSFSEQSSGATNLMFGAYENGVNTFAYTTTGDSPSMYSIIAGKHEWSNAIAGTEGNTLSFVKRMVLNTRGALLLNTSTDNGADIAQFNGTISASPATTANQVPTWGQVQAAASSGRYTPTVNVITGAASVSVHSHTYIKIGDIVTVYGESRPTPVVTGVTVIYEISLPIARANTTTKALGFGNMNVAGGSTNQFVRLESTSATTVRISFNVNAAGTPSVLYSFQYDITQ